MEDDTFTTTAEGTETPDIGDGDVTQEGEHEKVADEGVDHEQVGGEGIDEALGEHIEGEHIEGEHVEGEHVEGEDKEKILGEGEEHTGEELEGEHLEGEETERTTEDGEEPQPPAAEEVVEEEGYVEEPPPDPTAPYDFSDSKEALREPYELRPDQLAEIEQLWEIYQNYTPVYTDLDGFITEKELVYMLKSLLIMTYTPEQLQELIEYCVKPPHPDGHIDYDQFLKMVIMRQRDFAVEEELHAALQVMDPEKTGSVDREYLKDVLTRLGHKMPQKQLHNFIKEVDLSNDGTIGIDDVVGTMCIDLNKEDLMLLRASIFPDNAEPPPEEEY